MTAPQDDSRWARIAQLVDRAKRGDDKAFRELLAANVDAVATTLGACGIRQRATAEDLSQEVALVAWQKLRSLDNSRAFRPWIRRIAANCARDHLRKRMVRREDDLDEALGVADLSDPESEVARAQETRLMLAALAAEDDETRRILILRADGSSSVELAEQLGVTPDAIRMKIMRARKRLKERLRTFESADLRD